MIDLYARHVRSAVPGLKGQTQYVMSIPSRWQFVHEGISREHLSLRARQPAHDGRSRDSVTPVDSIQPVCQVAIARSR
jgi:hypothetical protein